MSCNYPLATSSNKAEFMRDCEKNYSMWTFSGGFRTWVKISLVRTSGQGNETVEFRQEVGYDFFFFKCSFSRNLQHSNGTVRLCYNLYIIFQSSVVKYIDRRPIENQTDELFFIVFQWRDPFIQQVKDVSRRLMFSTP